LLQKKYRWVNTLRIPVRLTEGNSLNSSLMPDKDLHNQSAVTQNLRPSEKDAPADIKR